MFKPINWKTLPRDFAVIQAGFALFGLSIAILIQANAGTNPWVMLTVALADITGLSIGVLTQLTGLIILAIAMLMRVQIGWGTLGNILFIGPWVDLFLRFVPSITGNWVLQGAMLLVAIVMMGLASAIYIGVKAGAGPRDSLMIAVAKFPKISIQVARNGIELVVLFVAWALGEAPGVGTLIFALLIGPSVQWAFKLLNVERETQVQQDSTSAESAR